MLLAATAAWGFQRFIVAPAFSKLPSGNYGEAFGYVSYFKGPVYAICIVVFVLGVCLILRAEPQRQKR
jgi:hypothetical protein